MPNLKFSVPYNNKFQSLERLLEIENTNENEIKEVYLSGPQEYFGSGRAVEEFGKSDLVEVLDFCRENGIESNLLLNSTCEGLDWYKPERVSEVLDFLKDMKEVGLDAVTVANLLYLQKIAKEVPDLKITASVLSNIDSVQRAMFFDDFGADVITPDRDINRDLELLKKIDKAVDAKLKIMVNEGCLFKCPYRKFHFNLISHYAKEGKQPEDKFFFNCYHIDKIDPSQVLKSAWIRPEDLKRYEKITDWFKLVGRTRSTDWIVRMAKAYLGEECGGNLLKIMDSNLDKFRREFDGYLDNKKLGEFIDKLYSCDRNCSECDYCQEVAEKVLEFE